MTCQKFFLGTILLLFGISVAYADNPTQEEAAAAIEKFETIEKVEAYLGEVAYYYRINEAQKQGVDLTKTPDEETRKKVNLVSAKGIGEIRVLAGERITKIAKTDEERTKGAALKVRGLQALVRWAEQTGDEKLELQYRRQLDKFQSVAPNSITTGRVAEDEYSRFVREKVLPLRKEFQLENFRNVVEELKNWSLKQSGRSKPSAPLFLALDLASQPKAITEEPNLLEKTLNDVTDFVKSDKFTLSEDVKKSTLEQLESFSRRIVGADPKLYGKTFDNKDFDWTALRGKYVLVKFTASWCGPCKREIPGMIEAYKKYHDKGFEIVEIYVLDTLEKSKKLVESEKLSWIVISEELTKAADQPAQGNNYAINGVPTMFLVDKDGKIIDTNARGEHLQKKLTELFPDEK